MKWIDETIVSPPSDTSPPSASLPQAPASRDVSRPLTRACSSARRTAGPASSSGTASAWQSTLPLPNGASEAPNPSACTSILKPPGCRGSTIVPAAVTSSFLISFESVQLSDTFSMRNCWPTASSSSISAASTTDSSTSGTRPSVGCANSAAKARSKFVSCSSAVTCSAMRSTRTWPRSAKSINSANSGLPVSKAPISASGFPSESRISMFSARTGENQSSDSQPTVAVPSTDNARASAQSASGVLATIMGPQ